MSKFSKGWKDLNTFQKTLTLASTIWFAVFLASPDLGVDLGIALGVAAILAGVIQDVLEKRRQGDLPPEMTD